MDVAVKIFVLGLVGAIGTIILNKANKQDLAVIMDLALLVIALSMVFHKIKEVFDAVLAMFGGFM